MNYLEELKDLVVLHAHAQGMDINNCSRILSSIEHLEDDVKKENSWCQQWVNHGDQLSIENKSEQAFQCYNLARFPFISTNAQQVAYKKCVDTFNHWVLGAHADIQSLSADFDNVSVPFYFRPGPSLDAPLLLVMGGIVSIKEQWYQFLAVAKRLGLAVAVCEMPGVGENPLVYKQGSYRFIGSLIDSLEGKANINNVHMVGFSFSGHMALKLSQEDKRIKAITTSGAPAYHFFTDKIWWDVVPLTTKRTLAHICNVAEENLFDVMQGFALDSNLLKKVDIPVYYVRSLRDEIIPAEEKTFLLSSLKNIHFRENDDVHGSPHHMQELRKYVPITIFKATKRKRLITFALELQLKILEHKRILLSSIN